MEAAGRVATAPDWLSALIARCSAADVWRCSVSLMSGAAGHCSVLLMSGVVSSLFGR